MAATEKWDKNKEISTAEALLSLPGEEEADPSVKKTDKADSKKRTPNNERNSSSNLYSNDNSNSNSNSNASSTSNDNNNSNKGSNDRFMKKILQLLKRIMVEITALRKVFGLGRKKGTRRKKETKKNRS